MAKDLIVLVIDVGPPMDDAPPTGGDTPLECSLRVANQIVFQKIFAGAKDEVGVVLFGTADTDNDLSSDEGGYDNISTVWTLSSPNIDLIKFLQNQIKLGPVSGDFIDAIVVAMDTIMKGTRDRKISEKKIYLFTDGSSGCSDDQLGDIVNGLKSNDIDLIIIGPHLQPSDDLSGPDPSNDRPLSGPDPSSGCGPSSSLLKKTPQQVAGEQVLTRLINEADGCSYNFSDALNVASFIRRTAKKQTTRFAGHLEIGSQLKIPCKIFTKTMLESPSTWKKLSAISQSSAHPGNMAVKIERSYHLQDEDETEVESVDIAKGYRYGKSLIPVSSEDEEAMKLLPQKCLSLLGFTSKDNIKQHHLIGSSVQVVIANPDSEPAAVSLSAIIHALYETNMVAIVRYVFRNNAGPRLCTLVPHIKPNHECLFLHQLPYMEDVRQYSFSSLSANPKLQPSDDQLKAIDDLIVSMELSEGTDLETKHLSNPVIQRTFQCMEHRALNPDDPLPEIDTALERCLRPNDVIMRQCAPEVLKVKNIFPLTIVEKKDKSSGATTVWQQTSEINLDTEAPPSKYSKTDDTADFSVASLAKGDIREVGTVDPVGDYKKLVESNNFKEATRQLQEVILRLIKESLGDVMYSKATDSINIMRREAIKNAEPVVFNAFLRLLRDDLIGTRYSPFWDTLVEGGVSLITSSECAESNVSESEMKEFLVDQAPLSPIKEQNEEEDDDLLAMMD